MSKNLAGNIVNFLQSIGADNELPDDRKERVVWLNHFHTQLAINNPLWPEDLPFGYIYGAFVNAVIYNRVELKGHNIHAFITAFKNWITQSGIEDQLRRGYYNKNPEAEPEKLEGRHPEPDEETKKLQAEGYVNMPPHTVKQQIETLEMIYGGWEKALNSVNGMRCYRRRLQNTKEKYIEEGKWPE